MKKTLLLYSMVERIFFERFKSNKITSILFGLIICVLFSCDKKNDDPSPRETIFPSLTIDDATYITPSEATLQGELITGTQPVIDYGFIYSTKEINEFREGIRITFGKADSATTLSAVAKGLAINHVYFARAYVVTKDTIIISSQISFTTGKINQWINLLSYPLTDLFKSYIEGTYVVNGKVYFVSNPSIISGSGDKPISIHEYDPVSHQYAARSDCPCISVWKSPTFAIKDTIYIVKKKDFKYAGNSYSTLGETWKYSVTGKTWTRGEDFPINNTIAPGTYGFQSTSSIIGTSVNSEKGYVSTSYSIYQPTSFEYEPLHNKWTKNLVPGPAGDAALNNFIATSFSWNLSTGNLWYFNLLRYDQEVNKWKLIYERIPRNNTSYINAFLVANERKLYFIGKGNTKEFLEYNISTNTWTNLGPSPGINIRGGFLLNNAIYAIANSTIFVYIPSN